MKWRPKGKDEQQESRDQAAWAQPEPNLAQIREKQMEMNALRETASGESDQESN